MSVLPSGVELPQEGGDNDIWDNKLNANWTVFDQLIRKQVALMNIMEPIGTIKMIPTNATVPTGWEVIADAGGRTMISSTNNINDDQKGGGAEWDETLTTSIAGNHQHAAAGSHQHPSAGGHRHDAIGNHNHGSAGNHQHAAAGDGVTANHVLTRAQLPNFKLQLENGGQVWTGRSKGAWDVAAGTSAWFDGISITQTESLGSGQGHSHTIGSHQHPATGAHTHSNDGGHHHTTDGAHTHGAVGDHQHDTNGNHTHTITKLKWIAGGKWIKKTQDLTLQDLLDQTPVN